MTNSIVTKIASNKKVIIKRTVIIGAAVVGLALTAGLLTIGRGSDDAAILVDETPEADSDTSETTED